MAKTKRKKQINLIDIFKTQYIYRVELEYKALRYYEYKSNDLLNVNDLVICEAGNKRIYGRVVQRVHKSEQIYNGKLRRCFSCRSIL